MKELVVITLWLGLIALAIYWPPKRERRYPWLTNKKAPRQRG